MNETFQRNISNVEWRMNNLYWIKDKDGNKVKFKLNWAQTLLLKEKWFMNCILKARQLGMSTFIAIYILDCVLFGNNIEAGIVDRTRDDAKKKIQKIRYAWEHMDDPDDKETEAYGKIIKQMVSLESDNKEELRFSNEGVIWCGVSLRGGTIQILWISELGYIAFHNPDKAREIMKGSMEAVGRGNLVFSEATHEGGPYGEHYELIKSSMANQDRAAAGKLDPQEWKFHFFPWHRQPEYVANPDDITISQENKKYFKELESNHGIKLSDEQKAWYQLKQARLRESMLSEYPTTADEALRAVVRGAIYGKEMSGLRASGAISSFHHDPLAPMYAAWDLGFSDSTSIWLLQLIGREVHWIDFYQCSRASIGHYANKIREWERDYNLIIASHLLPHDAQQRDRAGGSYVDDLREAGISNYKVIPRTPDVWIGINSLRDILPRSRFHIRCDEEQKDMDGNTLPSGISCLSSYHVDEDSKTQQPVHDAYSHGADAARTFSEGWRSGVVSAVSAGSPQRRRFAPVVRTGIRGNTKAKRR